MTDLGYCNAAYCDRPAVAYVFGTTTGTSPRVTFITGPRAAELAASWPTALRCLDCAHHEVDLTIAGVRTPSGQVHPEESL